MRALVIPASLDLRMAWIELADDTHVRLAQLQQLVGGNIEAVGLSDRYTFWGWEEARLFDAPVNEAVTAVLRRQYGYTLVGDFVLCGATADGDDCEPPAIVAQLVAGQRGEQLPDVEFPFDVILASLGMQREMDAR